MAVDAPAVRKDLFDLVRMFGPANAGGPTQANTNPGASQAPPAALPPPPSPAETQAKAPEPTGVRTLPQGTPIQDNSAAVAKAIAPPQGGTPQQGPIELLPGDADPNLLPPEIRDSWMFRYQQAQRAAQYKAAEEQARWQNVVGGIGNIAQIATGGRPTNATGARAGAPEGTDVGTLYGWKKEYDKAQQDAKAKADYSNLVGRLQREHPELSAAAIEAISQDPKKLADYGFNQADAKAIADAAKAQIGVVKDTQGLAGANINDPAVIAETAKILGVSPEYVMAMPIDVRLETAKTLTASRVQGQGEPGKELTPLLIKEAHGAVTQAGAARLGMTHSLQSLHDLQAGKGWTGPISGNATFQQGVQMAADILGLKDVPQITNSQKLKTAATNALIEHASKLGTQPSNADREVIARLVGADGTMNREALVELHRSMLRQQLQAQITAQDKLRSTGDIYKDDPRMQAWIKAAGAEIGEVPNLTGELFDPKDIASLTAYQTSTASDAEKKASLADFDKQFGRGMAAYVLGQQGGVNAR